MANKAISELPQALNVNNQDLFVLEQGGLAKKLTAETFITEQGIIDALAEALDGHGGIQSVTLQSLSGRVRTYLITFSDGSATTFQVLDGSTITNIQKTSTAGLVDTYTVYMSDGTTTFFQVRNGQDGSATWDQINSKAPIITDTVTGAIASFPDGADDIPVADLVVNIEPKQSGSGDPAPDNIRPITGFTGANVYDDPKYGGMVDWNQLVVNGNFADGTNNWTKTNQLSLSASNNKLTATASSKSTYAAVYQENIPTIPTGHKVLISCYVTLSQAEKIAYGNGSGIIATSSTLTANTKTQYWIVTTISSTPLAKLYIYTGRTAGLEVGGTCTIEDVQVYDLTRIFGAGNEPTTFSAFNGIFPKDFYEYNIGTVTCASAVNGDIYKQIQIDWTAEAGTVYGGSLDVTTGVLTVDRALVDIGDLAWSDGDYSNFTSTSLQSTILIVSTSTVPNLTCSVLKTIKFDDRSTETAPRISMNNAGRLDVRGTSYASATAFKTAMTGQKIAYELATPQTYQLTPQQLNTLLGTNNIWADTGNVDIDYRADTKLYIEKLTMPTEDDMVANSAISSGSFFMIGNTLYRATTAIASGATITVGTNATRLSLADALNALNT